MTMNKEEIISNIISDINTKTGVTIYEVVNWEDEYLMENGESIPAFLDVECGGKEITDDVKSQLLVLQRKYVEELNVLVTFMNVEFDD